MSSGKYTKGIDKFSTGDIDWVNDTIKAVLIDTDLYTVDLVNDEYLEDILSSARISEVTLSGKSAGSGGIVNADDTTFPNVTTGKTINAFVLYKDTGFENSSPLIIYVDNAPQFPVVTDGDDIIITWYNGSDKIFVL